MQNTERKECVMSLMAEPGLLLFLAGSILLLGVPGLARSRSAVAPGIARPAPGQRRASR